MVASESDRHNLSSYQIRPEIKVKRLLGDRSTLISGQVYSGAIALQLSYFYAVLWLQWGGI